MTVKELMKQLQNLPSGAIVYYHPQYKPDSDFLHRIGGSTFFYTPRHRSGTAHLTVAEDTSTDEKVFSSSKTIAVIF